MTSQDSSRNVLSNSHANPRELYIKLLKHSLIGMIDEDPPIYHISIQGYPVRQYIKKIREWGRDAPKEAYTMIGLRRMNNIQFCLEQALADGVPGDCIETGVWRGGATIFMRGILAAHQVTDRSVWVADSFQGLPQANVEKYSADEYWRDFHSLLAVSEADVRYNFQRYELLDDQVRFLPGWFKDTLPTAPIEQLAVLRLDGDLYESTWDVLTALYPKVAIGGFVIVDDYHFASCSQAINDYRSQHGITEEIIDIDRMGVYWRRER